MKREERSSRISWRSSVVADQCHDSLPSDLPSPSPSSSSPILPMSQKFVPLPLLLPLSLFSASSYSAVSHLASSISFFFSFFRDSEIRGIRILFLGIDAHTHRSMETIEKSGCELLKLNHVRIHLYRSFFRGTSNVGIEIETVRTIAEIQRKEGGRRT